MAKWGEGDPRWIVEERPDAKNVNNWHWTEKNACQWSQDTLKKLLVGLELEGDHFRCIITDVDSCTGEAVVNNRKGKIICLYEWEIAAAWQGRVRGKEDTLEGKINIPNLSEENDISEVDVSFTLKENYDDSALVKQFLHDKGRALVREKLADYVKRLKEEFSQGLILPKKETCRKEQMANLTSSFDKSVSVDNKPAPTETKAASSTKLCTKTIKMSNCFQCTGPEIYNALTKVELISAFTCGPVKQDLTVGGIFEFFGGNIHGEFVELVPDKKIVQKWRSKRWPENHYSTVTMTVEQQNDDTVLNLVQNGVPESEYESTLENWDRYYWDAIKRTFGFGSFII